MHASHYIHVALQGGVTTPQLQADLHLNVQHTANTPPPAHPAEFLPNVTSLLLITLSHPHCAERGEGVCTPGAHHPLLVHHDGVGDLAPDRHLLAPVLIHAAGGLLHDGAQGPRQRHHHQNAPGGARRLHAHVKRLRDCIFAQYNDTWRVSLLSRYLQTSGKRLQ